MLSTFLIYLILLEFFYLIILFYFFYYSSVRYFSYATAGETVDPEQAGPAHPGVVCDSCDKYIFGVRFKCVVCPNYDLCMTCETKGMHKEHEMLRITTPRTAENNWFHGFNPFAFGHPPPPHHPPHGPPPHHPPHGPPPHHPPHGPQPQGIPPIQIDFGHGFGPWGRGWGRGCGRRGGGPGRCPKGRRCNGGGKKCDRHTTESNPGEVPVGPPFLHAVGESIASFLGPFGVEVHTYASNEPGMPTSDYMSHTVQLFRGGKWFFKNFLQNSTDLAL